MTVLRDYQLRLVNRVREGWDSGRRNVLAVSPTGSGKSATMAHILKSETGPCCAIAHRQELVGQIALALAREGIRHRIIAPMPIRRLCMEKQEREVGRHYVDPQARVGVAGIDTLLNEDGSGSWLRRIELWEIDEAHHVQRKNKWGRAVAMLPATARGLGVTATACRADGGGLGAHADGVFHDLALGPTAQDLINAGWLSSFRLFCPPSDLDVSSVPIGATGDYSQAPLRAATHKSHLVGDVVDHYLRLAAGERGVTFAVDVEESERYAEAFRKAGVPALAVSAKTPARERDAAIRKLEQGEVLQLVNCDLFGEGFDLPMIRVVSLARKTMSLSLSDQQIGRALRPKDGPAIIIDHVGNTCTASGEMRHGTPNMPRRWTLDRRERRSSGPCDVEGVIPIRACPQCSAAYERIYRACPYCGYAPVPASRSAPAAVDGDLIEMDATALEAIAAEIRRIDGPAYAPQGVPRAAVFAIQKNHADRQTAQSLLRESMAVWAGMWRGRGASDSESYRRFYLQFGIDAATAQTLGAKDAEDLRQRIDGAVRTV